MLDSSSCNCRKSLPQCKSYPTGKPITQPIQKKTPPSRSKKLMTVKQSHKFQARDLPQFNSSNFPKTQSTHRLTIFSIGSTKSCLSVVLSSLLVSLGEFAGGKFDAEQNNASTEPTRRIRGVGRWLKAVPTSIPKAFSTSLAIERLSS